MNKLNDKETFIALFNQLHDEVKGSPTKLTWLVDEKPKIKRLAIALGETAIKIKSDEIKSLDKSSIVPNMFVSSWKEYKKNYKETISILMDVANDEFTQEFVDQLNEAAKKGGRDLDEFWDEFYESMKERRKQGDSFDPVEDNPVDLIYEILMSYYSLIDSELVEDEEYADKAIGAWNFFENTIGIKHESIYERWKSIPILYIPKHAASVNPTPIIELYHEAVKTYVFGNKIASISMCRALLEHVLQKHYKIEGKDLADIIVLAEKKYHKFKKYNLHDKRQLANTIMHKYEKNVSVEDSIVIDFLTTLRDIVKDIPRK